MIRRTQESVSIWSKRAGNEGKVGLRRFSSESNDKKKRIWTRDDIDAAAAKRRRHEEAVQNAQWATSWMTPWERAHMDGSERPLQIWEHVYWRLFIVLGSVGFVYETWVLGNRGMWKDDFKCNRSPSQQPKQLQPHLAADDHYASD